MWPALRTLLSAVQHRCLRPCAIRAATRARTSQVPHKSRLCPRSAASPCPLALSQRELPGRAGQRRWAPGARAARAAPGVCTAAQLSRGSPAQSPGGPAATATTGRARCDTRGRFPLLAAALPSPRPPLAGETRRSGGAGRGEGGRDPATKSGSGVGGGGAGASATRGAAAGGRPLPPVGGGGGGHPLPAGVAPKTLTTGTRLAGASRKRDWQGSRPGSGLPM